MPFELDNAEENLSGSWYSFVLAGAEAPDF
jgi:hypothetical protein